MLLLTIIAQAQDYRFGKVSKAELENKQHKLEPEANAAILYKEEKVHFIFSKQDGFIQNKDVYVRLKIYNKEGYEYATKKIKFYDETSSLKEKIFKLKGYTYVLKNGEVEKIKLKSESVFEDKLNKYWSSQSFTMPSVEEGCIIEYKYTVSTPFMGIQDLIIQENIPTDSLNLRITIPEYFNYNLKPNLKAILQPKITKSISHRQETVTSSNRSQGIVATASVNSSVFGFKENVYQINMANISSLKEEPLLDNIENYRSKLALEYAYFKSADGVITPYSTSWEKVTEKIYKSSSFGDQLEKDNYFKDQLSVLLKDATSNAEKIVKIFEHVKSKVKWNEYIGYNTDDGVKKAYNEGVGNVAEINLILIAMLKQAGIKANPVLISTRNNGVPLMPTREGFNYIICGIEDTNGLIYLDATNRYSTPNILPKRTLNWLGRIIREDNTSAWVDVIPKKASSEIIALDLSLKSDLTQTGILKKRLTDYLAYSYFNHNSNLNEDQKINEIENNNIGLEILEYSEKSDNYYQPVNYEYTFNYDGSIEKIGDQLYLSPLSFLYDDENVFIQDKRNYPIDFVIPNSKKYIISLDLPEGYKVASLPESATIYFKDKMSSFKYRIMQQGNKINLMIDFNISQTLILPQDYPDFKQFYQFVKDKEAEKIVLVKT